jgi:hypothetical protein
MFQGEIGEYFRQNMLEKKAKEENPAAVSKRIGWGE